MRALTLLLVAGLGPSQVQPAPAPAAPPPGTNTYLVRLPAGLASMTTAKPVPVSNAPGYDNQSMFSPHVSRLTVSPTGDPVALVVAEPKRP